jgi:thioredoxin
MSESSPTPNPPSPPRDAFATAAPGAIPPEPPKRRAWLLWLLGGVVALALLCVTGVVLLGGLLFMRNGSTAANPAVQPQVVRISPTEASEVVEARQIYDVHANARQDIAHALAQAKTEHKRVLLDFGADWCPDCVVLSHIFDDAQVKPFLDKHFVVVRVNVGQWDANLDVSEQYGDPIGKGIPAVVVLSPDQQIVASTGGGELANARTATREDILDFLQKWAAKT